MANIFTLENLDDFSEKLNIDELYEKKRQYDLKQLELFNKILNRIHVKIKTTSRQKIDGQFCWFLVPEVIIGVPKYDQGACIAYLLDKLKENGFNIRYVHPNTLFISWMHWVPSYVRTELKKKTGIVVNEYGQKIDENSNDTKQITDSGNPNEAMFNLKPSTNQSVSKKDNKNYTPIKSYKPSGNLVYNDDLLNKIEDKFG
uniref:Uncharacterized protein n=1 Tax=viral metagenome TaxID=1070528 RepID=A0A6C0IHF4_9ZZZZ